MATTAPLFNEESFMDRALPVVTRAFTQILYWAFLLAGMLSAVVSAYAEYAVINSFYAKHASVGVLTFAGAMVWVLEVTKLFLIFFNRQYSSIQDAKYVAVRPVFSAIRYALVTISFLAMLLFTLFSLSNPNYDAALSHEESRMHKYHQVAVARLDSTFAARKAERGVLDAEEIEMWKTKMEFEMNNVVGRTWEGPFFAGHKARWEGARRVAAAHQEELDRERLAAVAELQIQMRARLDSTRNALKTDAASQNTMFSGALQVLNGSADVPSRQYTIAVIIASVLLSLTLEATMWAVFTALAITYGDAFVAALQMGAEADRYAAASRTSGRIADEDARQFRKSILREKRSVMEALRDLLHRR